MMLIYSYLKIILLGIIIAASFSILFYETTKNDIINYDQSGNITNIINLYETVKGFILYDPYSIDTGVKIESFRNDFIGIFKSAVTNVTAMTGSKSFYDYIYLYILSAKMPGMDALADRYFSGLTFFKDFFIIDSNNNILYKHSSNTIVPFYRVFNSPVNAYYTNDYLIIGVKYDNPLDLEIEADAVYDTDIILKKIKDADFNTFFLTEKKIYKNSNFNTDFIKDSLKEIKTGKKFTYESKIIETFPININGTYIGTLGVIYPGRTLGDFFLLFLKILALLIIIAGLLVSDHLITAWLKERKKGKNSDRKKNVELIMNEENEKNLDWLENYIKISEDKK